jgi:hypothetical protein
MNEPQTVYADPGEEIGYKETGIRLIGVEYNIEGSPASVLVEIGGVKYWFWR